MELGEYFSTEQNASYPQLPEQPSEPDPQIVEGIEAWDYRLAAEVISGWRELTILESELEFTTLYIFNELGLRGIERKNSFLNGFDKLISDTHCISLTRSITLRFESLHKKLKLEKVTKSDSLEWVEKEVQELAYWFYLLSPPQSSEHREIATGCLGQLQYNAQAVRSKSLEQLQAYFEKLRQAELPVLMKHLEELVNALENIYHQYHQQRQNYLQKESAAWRGFYNLKAPQTGFQLLFWKEGFDLKIVLRTLQTAYKFRLEAEIYNHAAQLIGELMQQTRLFEEAVKKADAFLGGFQDWLIQNSNVEPLFIPLLQESVKRADLLQLRRELEESIGYSFEQWGALEEQKTIELCQQLLVKTKILREKVHSQCYNYLLSQSPPQSDIFKQEPLAPAGSHFDSVEVNDKYYLQFQEDTDIREILWSLERVSEKKIIVDASVCGTISRFPARLYSFDEAIEEIRRAGNLTYTQKDDIYIFANPDI